MKRNAVIIAALLCISLSACGKEPAPPANSIETETTAATTETITETSASAPPPGVQISRIAGEYYYEVPDPADNSRWILDGTVSIAANGTYTYYPNSGAPVKGKIELTPEEYSNGDTAWWYSFYSAAGDMWIGITASQVMEEGNQFLYTGNGGATRLEINTGNPPSCSDQSGASADLQSSGDAFLGNWSVARLYITIEKCGDAYQVNVKQASSAAESTNWEYDCVYTGDYLDSTNGRCVEAVYDEEGNVSSSVRYTNGCAHFRLNADGTLTWEDLNEHWADDMPFLKLS